MTKRIFALLLALVMVFALTACKKESEEKKEKEQQSVDVTDGYIMKHNYADEEMELGAPKTTLVPQDVYSKIEYTPQMFYGDYRLLGGEEAEAAYFEEMDLIENQTETAYAEEITAIPYRITAGPHTMSHVVSSIEGYDWMRCYVKNEDGYLQNIYCSYEIEGNKLKLHALKDFETDSDNKKISYEFSDMYLEYEFKFSGRNLTLSANGKSVTMTTALWATEDVTYFSVHNYVSPGSNTFGNIEELILRYDESEIVDGEADSNIYLTKEDSTYSTNAVGIFTDDGLLTFTAEWEDGTVETFHYVYFYCDWDGIILTDGTNTYYYNDNYSDHTKGKVNEYVSEDQTGKLDELTEAELEKVEVTTTDLMTDLASAFEAEGINVTVDEETGELQMDSTILFGGDSAELSADGKEFLNKFVKAYTEIIYSDEYKDIIAKTMVEGHTAPLANSTYESGLPLSEERANVVKDYCLSDKTGVDTTELAKTIEAVGYSNSKPIKDKNGNVNLEASRRVSFRFIVDIDAILS